jgi:hypothetical protein
MPQILQVGFLLLLTLTATTHVILKASEWPAASARVWPWLRLRPWWPVAADHAAETLLRSSLSAADYRCLRANAFLEVPSPSYANRVYRIPRGPGQVAVLEGGRITERLCVQPVESLPEADVVLLHKLLIEADETRYLATANHFPRAVWR